MRTIYIDSNYICHAENAEGRTAIETDILDFVCDNALPCYRFIPASGEKVDFCQCIDSKLATAIQTAFESGQNNILTEVEGALGL